MDVTQPNHLKNDVITAYSPFMMSSKCSDLGPSDKAPGGGPCTRRLWVFLVLGALDIVFGLVTVGLYFNIQAVTTSNGLTEVFPGYIICLVVLIKGAIVLVLFWWRPSCLIFVCLSVAVGCGLLCVVSVILCATHVLSPIKNIDSCTYRKQESVCECQTSYRRDGLSIEFLPSGKFFRQVFNQSTESTQLHKIYGRQIPFIISNLFD